MRLGRRTHAAPKRGRIRKRRFAALLLVLVALSGAAFSFGLVTAIRSELAALDPSSPQRDVDTVIYSTPNASGQRRVLAILRGDESRVLVGSEAIAPIMKQAIVVVEDKRFYEHNGVDLRGIVRALWQDIRSQGVVEGGSTITQQYVKNAYSRNEQTIARKVREAALAWQLTQRWSKDRILTAYLNTVYFGNGAYGILQAARTYFRGKSAAELTLPEAALLAGIPQSPARYDPVRHPAARGRGEASCSSSSTSRVASPGPSSVSRTRRPMPKPENVRLPGTRGPAPYFVGYVTDQLVARYGAERVFGGGLEVTTTIDLDLQDRAREAIQKVLTQPGGPAAALVAIDPRTGAVRAMFGGTNFRRSQFNLATQAERQPGSSFKPIVLASAFRQGIAPSTRLVSKPVEIDAGDRIWKVSNYEGSYLGDVDLARAMVSSDNSVYAQLTKIVGPKSIVDTAHRLGIRSELPAYFSIGLGAVAVNPLDMTRAYATIANDGKRVDGSIMGNVPRVVQEVRFRKSGKSRKNAPVGKTVLSPGAGGDAHRDPRERRPAGHGPARAAHRARRGRQDRDDGQLRRCLVHRLHAGARRRGLGRLPERAQADGDGVPRRAGRRRDAPRAHLEGVHDARAGGRGAAIVHAPAVPSLLRRARREPRRRMAARQRLLPRNPGHLVLRRARRRRRRRRATRTRSPVPVVVGRSVESARVALGVRPARGRRDLRPREAADAPGPGREAAAARRVPLRERQRAALGVDRPGRPRPESRRLEPPGCEGAEPEAQARAPRSLRRRAVRDRARAEPRAGDRDPARAPDHAARRARLDQLEPAST